MAAENSDRNSRRSRPLAHMPIYKNPALPVAAAGTSVQPYNYNANYTGAGLLNGGAQAPQGSAGADYRVYGTGANQGLVVSKSTGQPYSGYDDATQKHYQNGREVTPPPGQQFIPGTTTPIDPNDPNQRYRAVDVAKNPGVSSATDALLENFKKTADASLQDFGQYKSQFQKATQDAFDKTKAAADITGYTRDVTGQQGRYSAALDTAAGNAGQANADAAAREQAALGELRSTLPMYDKAAQNAADYQLGQLNGQVSRYKLLKGGGLGLGSDELAMQAAGARAIQIPTELAKIQARQNIAQNVELPIVQQDANRSAQFYQQFMPGVAANQYNSATAVSNAVQQLKVQTAGMSYQNAMQYMQSIGVPEQIQQQILGQQLNNLGAINSLESGSRYQGLQDILGANISQPVGYNPSIGGLPVTNYSSGGSRYDSNVAGPVTSTGTNGYDPGFGQRLDAVKRINASRYQPVNPASYNSPNATGPYDTPNGWADYNQPFDYASYANRIPLRQIE